MATQDDIVRDPSFERSKFNSGGVAEQNTSASAPAASAPAPAPNDNDNICHVRSQHSVDIDTDPDKFAVLRVECIEAKTLKVYLTLRFLIETPCQGVWIAAFVSTARGRWLKALDDPALLTNSLVLSAICGPILIASSASFMQAIFLATRTKQIWSRRRRRLVILQNLQLLLMVLSNLFLALSSGFARQNPQCRLYTHFCAWCDFVIWTGLVGALTVQFVLTHDACAWTDGTGRPVRMLLMQRWVRPGDQQRHALLLDAPWLVHLPKLLLWLFVQISLIMQMVDSFSGAPYLQVNCKQVSTSVCVQTGVYHTAMNMRIAGLTVQQFWMAFVAVRGRRDMHEVPYNVGRLGRVLMRLRISRDMGLNHGGLLGVGLLLSAALAHAPCSSCAQSWLLLASDLQATTMVVLAAFLFKPVKPSSAKGLVMQVWLQYFAWTEKSVGARLQQRNDLGALQDKLALSQQPMFCFETAIKMLYWCGLAYEYEEGRGDAKLSEDVAMQMYGLQQLRLLRDSVTGTKCLIAWGPDHLIIAFRGTANMKNATHDAKAWMLPLLDVEESKGCGLVRRWHTSPAVHAGFRTCWHAGLRQSATSLITEAICSSAVDAANINVVVAGHSLGGVMAVIAALDIADLASWCSLQVYTMGAPRPGNRAFAKICNDKLRGGLWHIINERDPVPLIGKFGSIYARPGHRVLINVKGDMLVRPTPLDIKLGKAGHRLNRHYLAGYRKSLEEVIRVQLRQPKFENGLQGVLELAESIDLSSTLLSDLDVKTPGQLSAAAATASSVLSPNESDSVV